jgi:Mlc titration factor MtfA (ptsG expression regulator)
MRRILRRNRIPLSVWHKMASQLTLLRGLDAVELAHLRELSTWFLHNKAINGVQGLNVTLPMRIVVAAQACLLILKLDVDYFDNWVEVILYPGAFRVNHEQRQENGLVDNAASTLSGEAWLRGPVILSWDDVRKDSFHAHPGHNVVVHEFAHKLDGRNGMTNGLPPLRPGMSRQTWGSEFNSTYETLRKQLEAGHKGFINPYAATNPAEFFAVTSEYFFTAPDTLKKCCPAVHKQLSIFYQQGALHY